MRRVQGSSMRRIRAAGQRAGRCNGRRDDSTRHRRSARSRGARTIRRPRRVGTAHRPEGVRSRHKHRPASTAALRLPHERAMPQRHSTGAGAAHGASTTRDAAAQRESCRGLHHWKPCCSRDQWRLDREPDGSRPSAMAHQRPSLVRDDSVRLTMAAEVAAREQRGASSRTSSSSSSGSGSSSNSRRRRAVAAGCETR